MELVGGERLYGVEGFRPYLAAGVWAVIMPDVKHCGGIAAMLHIGAAAYGRSVAVSPHNPSGPVACVASAHAVACLPHARALEYAWGEVPWRADIITRPSGSRQANWSCQCCPVWGSPWMKPDCRSAGGSHRWICCHIRPLF
jgi:L-alanine-DL-glutamate epimerase-like enolase superfamily enzyme